MQGVDTALLSLCHGNNTKLTVPPFCLSTCICFVSLFLLFLSLACTVSSLGVRLSPSQHHSPAPGTNYIMQGPFQFLPSEERMGKDSRSILPERNSLFPQGPLLSPDSNRCSFILLLMKFLLMLSKIFFILFYFIFRQEWNTDTSSVAEFHCSRMLASEPYRIVWAFTTPGSLLRSSSRLIPRSLQSSWPSEH